MMDATQIFNACLLIAIAVVNIRAEILTDNDELLNWCIDARNHKERPGPEDTLHEQCVPWKNRSCCTHNTTYDLHITNAYGFNWDHCSAVKPMSPACQKHFIQDLCFYECEPNLGPWVVQVDMKIRKERAFGVPLCASECDAWYNDCKDDLTCVDNWVRKFVWIDGRNTCPLNSTCKPYKEIFRDSKNFCESIWDFAWTYTPDHKPCMKIWFNGTEGNPNEKVARAKVAEMYKVHSGSEYLKSRIVLDTIISVIISYLLVNL
ncbi:hypothetical protein CHUAL_007134 [Chamberlinius hualienensis]